MVEGTGMVKFVSLGSGSSGNCYYLSYGNTQILIDAGISVRALKRHLKDKGIRLDSIDAVFITHDHADHIKSVGSFSKDQHVPVYTTKVVHEGITKNYCVQQKVPSDYVNYVEKGTSFTIGDFKITPFGVPHDSSDNVRYMVEAEGTAFCVITDAGYVTDEMKEYISKADYLVIEANHDVEMVKNGPYPAFLKERILSHTGHLSNVECGEALVENMSEHLETSRMKCR